MASDDHENGGISDASDTENEALARLNANLTKMDALTKRLVGALANKKSSDHGLQGPGPDVYAKAMAAYFTEMANNPAKIIEHQVGYWGEALKTAVAAQQAMLKGESYEDNLPSDKRFKDPMWRDHPWFSSLRQQYQISAEAINNTVHDLEGLDKNDKRRVEFFSQQIVDLFAPTNFLPSNPEAMRKAVETEGESLVHGLENLVRDIERNDGDWLVTLSDPEAFSLGDNIASTEGSVVFRNRMFELIQYAPTTEKVRRTPLLLFPPWINKFYVLDLKEKNSLVKWIVDQGYTLFVVSWVNPGIDHTDVRMQDYVDEGYLTAMDVVKEITGEEKINAIGYCIAGTTLAMTLALMARRGDKSVRSATFFTTMTDFSDTGEMSVFLDEDFVAGIERESAKRGYLDKFFMGRTFSYLRSNDLVYAPAVKSYMLGEAPPAFDLLHWNGDGTNLPGPMVVEYLRDLCMGNKLAQGEYSVMGETDVGLSDVEVPVCAIACETDHIAQWKGSFEGVKGMGSKDKTFILSESGHIAGIVNPPSKKKYGHYTQAGPVTGTPEEWQAGADFNEGSWWPTWEAWLAKRSGAKIKARQPGGPNHPVLEAAPGSYVRTPPKVA